MDHEKGRGRGGGGGGGGERGRGEGRVGGEVDDDKDEDEAWKRMKTLDKLRFQTCTLKWGFDYNDRQ